MIRDIYQALAIFISVNLRYIYVLAVILIVALSVLTTWSISEKLHKLLHRQAEPIKQVWHTDEFPTVKEWQGIINQLRISKGLQPIKTDGMLTWNGQGETEKAWEELTR